MNIWVLPVFSYYKESFYKPPYIKSLYGHMLSFLLDKNLKVGSLGHMPSVKCLREQPVFQNSCTTLYSQQQCMTVLTLPQLLVL